MTARKTAGKHILDNKQIKDMKGKPFGALAIGQQAD